ncbi:hepatitis A virus cellular receptor 1 homolog isoform X2 [Centropristis striata]|uniref:hepatitis A virus cellular receptor 1 homolog isoform X2 n=1 Tax=Centropristis striata TaxID=184440 RepID=UPI0027E00E6D|nr:hepatitis A virus cellular receptor 1 homolog isoform X2 [Centropristis striata]
MRGLCYLFLSVLTQASSSTFKVIGFFGHNVTLPCRYDAKAHGVLSFCWGRAMVPASKCSNTILSSQDGAVLFKESPRYQLLGRGTDGDVSLTIRDAQLSDAGVYGCRLEVPGWFNDKKVNTRLFMEEAPVEPTVTPDWTLTTDGRQEILTTSLSENDTVGDILEIIGISTEEEDFFNGENFHVSTP